MPRIDIETAPSRDGTAYPPPYDAPCRARRRRRLGNAAGLTQFGVNHLILEPGVWSSQRHWHQAEDEFVWVLEGEVVLIENAGETVLRAGDCAGFAKGAADGHHIVNRSDRRAVLLEVGARHPEVDRVTYPDIDLAYVGAEEFYRHRDGSPYPGPGRVK